jgi:mRNA interferase YafQ
MSRYSIHKTSTFKKNYKKLIRSGSFSREDAILLDDLIFDFLAMGKPLDEKYRDHSLQGYGQKRMREFHFKPDLLVRYEIIEKILVLSLEEINNHNSMFG